MTINVDWTAIKLRYINGTVSLRELASVTGVNANTLMKRSEREGWADERRRVNAKISNETTESISNLRVTELAKFNDDDLKMARLLRSLVGRKIEMAVREGLKISPNDLAALARTADVAQKIGRLAMGAETENVTASFRKLEPLPDDAFLG